MSMLAQMMPGMQFLPLLIATVVIALSMGVLSLCLVLFLPDSKLGRQCARWTIWLGLASPLLFAFLTGSHLLPIGYYILASPLLVGLLAYLLSEPHVRPFLRYFRVVFLIIAALSIAIFSYNLTTNTLAGRDMMALLKGSSDISLTGFTIQGQQRRVVCRDSEVCRFLTACLRHSEGSSYYGSRYRILFDLSTGRNYDAMNSFAGENGLTLSIPEANPSEYGLSTHGVSFPEPVPDKLKQLWAFLDERDENVRGTVLTLDSQGNFTRTTDRALRRM